MSKSLQSRILVHALFASLGLFGTVARAVEIDESVFRSDFQALTAFDHRLPGSEGQRETARFLESRLREIGIDEVHTLRFETWYPELQRSEMVVDGAGIPIFPLRPNLVIWPNTPEEGLTAPLLYVGKGDIQDYGARNPEGRIVLMDYAASENWRVAFSLGAKAVVFVGEPGDAPTAPLHVPAPVNFLRFYVDRSDLPADPGELEGREVSLFSRVKWQSRPDQVIYGRVHGRDSEQLEPILLAAHYDSFGNVPHRSPAARGAANTALVLQAARHFAANTPQRDVAFLLTSSRAYNHQGARYFYEALTIPDAQLNDVYNARLREESEIQGALDLLLSEGLRADPRAGHGDLLARQIFQEAEFMNADLTAALQRRRLTVDRMDDPEMEALRLEIEEKVVRRTVIDDIRRALFGNRFLEVYAQLEAVRSGEAKMEDLALTSLTGDAEVDRRILTEIIPSVLEELLELTRARFEGRLAELNEERTYWENTQSLRAEGRASGESPAGRMHLHVSFNLGDASSRWGVVVGDPVEGMSNMGVQSGADAPGLYVRLLSQLGEISRNRGDIFQLNTRTLTDTLFGPSFVGEPYTSSAKTAGDYGFHNISLMTENDSRLRDGHPGDTPEALRIETFLNQGREALSLVEGMLDTPNLAVTRPIARMVTSKYYDWRNGRSWGDFVSRTVVGGLAESRPAENALIAHWPTGGGSDSGHWANIEKSGIYRDYMPFGLQRANYFGRFSMVGQRSVQARLALFSAYFDERGDLEAISNQRSQLIPRMAASIRLTLFQARGHAILTNPGHQTFPDSLNIMKGTTNFAFPNDRVLWGTVNDVSFAYLAERDFAGGLKFFQRLGPVLMALPGRDPVADGGIPTGDLLSPPRVSGFSAENLWALNESRLSTMRQRGVSRTDLETYHSRALAAREQANEATSLAEEESLRLSSASISHRLHEPLRSSMDDLVTAIILLLLLTLPFAFAMERLLVGATSIYGRLSGFCVFFILTFGLLYFLHPGFAIASAPMIIFLAFTVLGLSAMVIQMLLRRFKQELKMLQGQGVQAHDAEVSRAGTTLAAIGMGMSTMRRRPTRTFLTAITVVALTFTILCFASFTREMGVRATYLGPSPEDQPDGVLVRTLNYAPLPNGQRELLLRYHDGESVLTSRWWLRRQNVESPRIFITNPANGNSVEQEAMIGFDVDELRRWPALREVAGREPEQARFMRDIQENKLFLPPFVMELLEVEPGDPVIVKGREMVVAEPLDLNRLQRLNGMDLESLIPLDSRQVDADAMAPTTEADILNLDAEVEQNFIRLGVGEISMTSNAMIRELGGKPHIMTLYPAETVNARELGQTLAAIVSSPVWVVSEIGVERMVLTHLTQISGVFAIAIPLFLGGLIIFGTLLGSISDREKEIYTFSALGLGPSHVGMLFFAEAGVYAVVGGMGGQLIAQIIAWIASVLANRGIIDPVSINFSSTNSLFAIGLVMLLVLVSSLYPAYRASKSANPGLARDWSMPDPDNDVIDLTFPFTVSAYDITGVVSFLAEHFRSFDDAGFGKFATTVTEIRRNEGGNLEIRSELALSPFDLGVTEELLLASRPSSIEGVDEVHVRIKRLSGAENDWVRGTRVFLKELRTQFLVWRTLSDERIESYRHATFQELGEV
ncbi:MAG: M28 family peptidase [Verrucomicrobia bacterium]|nr:M28 family peptidase [Verrucomicrobiota bacterium]MCH8510926.1 M28 family peptidase [Kiritimatiellia bacterium]